MKRLTYTDGRGFRAERVESIWRHDEPVEYDLGESRPERRPLNKLASDRCDEQHVITPVASGPVIYDEEISLLSAIPIIT